MFEGLFQPMHLLLLFGIARSAVWAEEAAGVGEEPG